MKTIDKIQQKLVEARCNIGVIQPEYPAPIAEADKLVEEAIDLCSELIHKEDKYRALIDSFLGNNLGVGDFRLLYEKIRNA
jgi:hypothetical protein